MLSATTVPAGCRDFTLINYKGIKLPALIGVYRSLREMFNHGARFVSPMAWNGSNGIFAGQKDFAAFTAIRNTPLEDAIRDFMISHANLPRHARYWGFGSLGHKDTDGWNAVNNGQIISDGGSALLMPATGTIIFFNLTWKRKSNLNTISNLFLD